MTRRSISGSAGRPRPDRPRPDCPVDCPFAAAAMDLSLARRSSAQAVPDGEVLESADEGGGGPLRPAGELDGFQPGQQLGEERARLHPRESGAEAEVDAEAERQMPVRVAADVEAE